MKLRVARKVLHLGMPVGNRWYATHRYSTARKAWLRLYRYQHRGHARPEFMSRTIWVIGQGTGRERP